MREILLTKEQVALIDDEDYNRVARYKWQAVFRGHSWYAQATIKNYGTIYMHHFIRYSNEETDHIDRNGLNNCKSNLRAATRSQNRANAKPHDNCSSKFKGVYWNKSNKTWIARIRFNGQLYYLGSFELEKEAAKKYDIAALDIFGEFARTNFDYTIKK